MKVDSPLQLCQSTRSLGFHLQDQDSPSSQSTQSNHDLTTNVGATNSQDQCISSESGQEVNCDKNVGRQAKPFYLMDQPDAAFSASHIDYNRTMTCMPYPCADPYFNGLLPAYGPAPVIQPQMMGVTTARVPLPLDHISEDEPIYVNAKQYHGILRRRQSRAKMEAQNKLIKVRKPYLHESRHLHALNRVRGSGGRFLSTKKAQHPESSGNQSIHGSNHNNANPFVFEPHHQSQGMETGTSNGSSNGGSGSYFQHHQDHGFPGNGGGFMNGSNQYCASVVR